MPLAVTDGSAASASTSSWSVAFHAVAFTPGTCQRASISASSSSTVAPNWVVTTASASVFGGPTVTFPSRTATTWPLASARQTRKSQSVQSYCTTSFSDGFVVDTSLSREYWPSSSSMRSPSVVSV